MSQKERLSKKFADEVVESFIAPLLEKQRGLFSSIQMVNKAHAVMLIEEGIVTEEDGKEILGALLDLDKIGSQMVLNPYLHEIYGNIESKIIEKIGPDIGGRMMTGRSRNDLYACAFRLSLRELVLRIIAELIGTIDAVLKQAEKHRETVMPGFTHTQIAQPTTLGHYLLGFADTLAEDLSRLSNCYAHVNMNPLGAAAFAGTGFPINRSRTTELLKFREVVESSIKSVGDYSYLLETISDLAILMNNVSRLMGDLIPWTSSAYFMCEIDDSFACSSSIMPQKKNPFTAETMRSISGEITGCLMQGLMILKGIPMGFNFDLLCFAGWSMEKIGNIEEALEVLKGLVGTMIFHKEPMEKLAWEGFSTATELADMLVKAKGMSFRTAHTIIAAAVKMAIKDGKKAISAIYINNASKVILDDTLRLTDDELGVSLSQIVESRKSTGGSSSSEVTKLINHKRKQIEEEKLWLENEIKVINNCSDNLDKEIKSKYNL